MTRVLPVSGSRATIQRSMKSSDLAVATTSRPSGEMVGADQRSSRGSSLPWTFTVPANDASAQTLLRVSRLRTARRWRPWASPTFGRDGMSSVYPDSVT